MITDYLGYMVDMGSLSDGEEWAPITDLDIYEQDDIGLDPQDDELQSPTDPTLVADFNSGSRRPISLNIYPPKERPTYTAEDWRIFGL